MKQRLLHSLVLLVLAAVLATAHGILQGPPPAPGTDDPFALDLAEAAALQDPLWIDARPADTFSRGHFPGALRLYDDNWDTGLGEILSRWSPGQALIIYCDGAACEKSRAMAREFREDFGMEEAYWLVGGFDTLLEEGVLR